MNQQSDFYVHLPSNINDPLFRDNTTAHFRTPLPENVNLDTKWEVALVSIRYTHSWYNIAFPLTIFHVRAKMRRGKGNRRDISFLTEGYYHTTQELVDELNEKKPDWLKSMFSFNDKDQRFTLWLKRNEKIALHKSLQKMLGFNQACRFYDLNFGGDSSAVVEDEDGFCVTTPDDRSAGTAASIKITGDRAANLHSGFDDIYVYTNLISNQIVGNTTAPLLRTVHINSKAGESVQTTFQELHYIPLQSDTNKIIEIKLCNSLGNLVPFEYGDCLIKLHFRKRHSYFKL